MKITLKIFQIIVISLITISLILFSASLLLKDKVSGIILESLNRNISTKLEIGSLKLSFINKFPKASLEIKNVLIRSSTDFNSDAFIGINTDTLFFAKKVSVEFKITDIMKGVYNIERVNAREGRMNFFTDTAGLVNYNISALPKNQGPKNLMINLEKVILSEMELFYNNRATKLTFNGLINTGRLKSRFSGDNVDFSASASVDIYNFQLYNTSITKTMKTGLDLAMTKSGEVIKISRGILSIEDWDFNLTGNISPGKSLDMLFSGNNIDLDKIRDYLPEKYMKSVSEYDPSGLLQIDGRINGALTRTSNPHIEIDYVLKNGHISYGRSKIALNNLSFSGLFSNGERNIPATSSFSVNSLKVKLGTAEYSGSFSIHRFNDPVINLFLNGRVLPSEIKEFFDIQNISLAEGYADIKLRLVNSSWPGKKFVATDIIDLKPEAEIVFSSFGIGLKKHNLLFNDVNGNLSVSQDIHANVLSFIFNEQKIIITGKFSNLPEWIAGRPVKLAVEGDVAFDRFIPEKFSGNTSDSSNSSVNKNAVMFPDDIILDVNFKIDHLDYKSFSSSEIEGKLNYRPKLLAFTSLSMKSLNGDISGNGFIVQNSNKSFIARGNFKLADVNVNKTFITFNNFGQSFIKAENLEGALSGSFSVLFPLDSLFKPQLKSLTAEGNYRVSDGALINFEPVKKLSSFIELSELENIRFTQLENDFYIRNNYLVIPQMEVKSSAADLSVKGTHGFDNNYEYHVKILLSEILSKKRKKNKNSSSGFGVIEDDGLGRTSLLLKIENRGKVVKVSYDVKAAGNKVKDNIKAERESLKSILNQEYGWYKSDTVPVQKTGDEKKRVRITWDDSENAARVPDVPEEETGNSGKSIFRKK